MTEIIIIGDENDTTLEKLIKTKLAETYRVTYIKGGELCDCGKGYELIVFDSRSPSLANSAADIIVAKRNAVLPRGIPRSCTVIINADMPSQPEAVRESGAFAVECGISPTSTVSYTSESDDTLMISLNRSMHALSGREIQPLELPVGRHGADNYTLMSFTALRLLLDDFESELGKLI